MCWGADADADAVTYRVVFMRLKTVYTEKIFNVANVKDHPKYVADIDNLKPNIDAK